MTGWRRWCGCRRPGRRCWSSTSPSRCRSRSRRDEVVRLVVSLSALGLLAVVVLVEVRHQLVDADRRIDGLVLALMIAVLGFALGFYALAQRDPTQIVGLETRLDSLYFTMTTLLTIGYGDIHAAGQAARMLVLIQMVFNVVDHRDRGQHHHQPAPDPGGEARRGARGPPRPRVGHRRVGVTAVGRTGTPRETWCR